LARHKAADVIGGVSAEIIGGFINSPFNRFIGQIPPDNE
jgi:hypothetical protein